jgi:putative endonuclease
MSSLSRTLYTGVTNDLERRVGEHKEGKPGSFTSRYKVNRLVYFEEFSDINQAIAERRRSRACPGGRRSS